MTLNPALLEMVRAASERYVDRNAATSCGMLVEDDPATDDDMAPPSVRTQLAWLGLQKATKLELQRILSNVMCEAPEA